MKYQLDATLCRFYFCRVTLHVSGASAHHQFPALIRRCDDLPATITHVPAAAVLVLNTPDDVRLRPKHVEWLYRNKTCTVLHQVGISFDLIMMILKRLSMKLCGSGGLDPYILNHRIESPKAMSLIFWLLFSYRKKKPRTKVSVGPFGAHRRRRIVENSLRHAHETNYVLMLNLSHAWLVSIY